MKRRDFVHAGLAAGAVALATDVLVPANRAHAALVLRSDTPGAPAALKQSVCKWCYPNISLNDLAAAGRDMGLRSIELLNPDEWATVQRYGLTCAVANAAGPGGIPRGFNRVEHHEWLIPAYETLLRQAAVAGLSALSVARSSSTWTDELHKRMCT
jgi:hydroxypyruvate isomerase